MSPPRDRGQPIIVRDEIAPMHNTTFMIHRFAVVEMQPTLHDGKPGILLNSDGLENLVQSCGTA